MVTRSRIKYGKAGFFDRMVRSVKRVLRKVLHNSKVAYDITLTILSEVQRILNNRPLGYKYEEIGAVLTRNRLLCGRSLTTAACGEEDVVEIENVFKRERHLISIITRFWNILEKPYLRGLREYNQRKNSCKYDKVSAIIEDPKLHRSNDDKVRTAIVDVTSDTGKGSQFLSPINIL